MSKSSKSRLFWLIVGAFAVVLVLALRSRSAAPQPPLRLDVDKIVEAMANYAKDRASHGEIPDTTVSLEQLINLGFLQPADVREFDGYTVLFHPDPGGTNSHPFLVEARTADGTMHVLLRDGSVQQLSPTRYREQMRRLGQPDGPANGSQPIRPETNRTPSAAGSRR